MLTSQIRLFPLNHKISDNRCENVLKLFAKAIVFLKEKEDFGILLNLYVIVNYHRI